jgi:uncharacterized protein YciI
VLPGFAKGSVTERHGDSTGMPGQRAPRTHMTEDPEMAKRFIFFYTMGADPARIRDTAAAHVAYWADAALSNYAGGPFADRSGGLITFDADDLAQAAAMVEGDPFLAEGLLRDHWLKEWQV